MKILQWNIRHGGSKNRVIGILDVLKTQNSDIVILTEFRENPTGQMIKTDLQENGWNTLYSTNPSKGQNGILIASKVPVLFNEDEPVEEKVRWVEFNTVDPTINVLAIHIPLKEKKKPFWNHVNQYAVKRKEEHTIIIGDYNTGLKEDAQGAPFKCVDEMEKLFRNGYLDSWREKNKSAEYTWYSNKGNGFRIDHAFISPSLTDQISKAYYLHEPRISGFSDHSAIVIELENINNSEG